MVMSASGQKRTFRAQVKDLRVEYLATLPMMLDETSPSCDDFIAKIAML
jgi:hypothetical protein